MIDENHRELLAQVASMYYDQEMTQSVIGEDLGLSRVKVYRLLKQAREEQIVQITIHWPIKRDIDLEKALLQAFDLKEAMVLATNPENQPTALRRLGQLGARYLEQVLKDDSVGGALVAPSLSRTAARGSGLVHDEEKHLPLTGGEEDLPLDGVLRAVREKVASSRPGSLDIVGALRRDCPRYAA